MPLAALTLALTVPTVHALEDGTSASMLLDMSLADLINVSVVTASRKAETRDRTPAHIMVVTREEIRERRYKNLADLLEDMPGVDFQRGTKTSQFNQFAVQGNLGPNRLLVLMDGVRISHPTGGTYPVAENLALYQAKQVEFLYGPAAALYGADAVSGVVNIITEAGNQEDGSWLSLGTGRFNRREASFMAGTGERSPLRLSVGGHLTRSDRARLDKYYKRYFVKTDLDEGGGQILPASQRERYRGETDSYSLFARVDMEDWLTLGYFRHQHTNLTSTVDPYVTTRFSDKARWISTTDTLYGRYRFELHDSLSSQLQVDYSRLEVDPRSHYNNVYNDFKPGYSYTLGERLGVEQSFDWQASEMQQVQAGLGWYQLKATEGGSMPFKYKKGKGRGDQGMYFPGTDETVKIPVLGGKRRNAHGYAQLLSEWSPVFSTTLGVRIDHHSAHGNTVNPRLGLVWKPHAQHLVKLLYGEAFREPSGEESLQFYGSVKQQEDGSYIGEGFRIPNLDLKPEKVKTLGLAWEWQAADNLHLATYAYHSRIRSVISTEDATDNGFIPGVVLINPTAKINAGRQKQTGLDLSVRWRFYPGDSWSADLWGSAGWIHGRAKEGSGEYRKLPYTAAYRFKLGSTFRYLDRVTVTPKIRWTGSVNNGRVKPPAADGQLPPAACNSNKKAPQRCMTPGHVVADLHLGWHRVAVNNLSLWLDIYNLTDKRYYAAAGSGSMTYWDMPQQPRSWVLSSEWRF